MSKPAQQDIDLRIYTMVSQSQDVLFERFDNLHKRGITDDDVIRTLRKGGHSELAAGYIEWSGAVDPDSDEDNTTTSPVVPDPGDAPSYNALGVIRSLQTFKAEVNDIAPGTVK
jgi:hypothetical protein